MRLSKLARAWSSFTRQNSIVSSIAAIVENLSRAQAGLLHAADSVAAHRWRTSPNEGRWSAGELVGHLISVERAIIYGADQLLQKPPKRLPFLKKLHVPLAVVEARLFRRKTPIPVDPQLLQEKEDMLAELRAVREHTLAFMEKTKARDLRDYCMPHAFLGTLNTYQWFQLIASHEARHTKQMREIAASLPKAVEDLQK
jgi:hypothetical protein